MKRGFIHLSKGHQDAITQVIAAAQSAGKHCPRKCHHLHLRDDHEARAEWRGDDIVWSLRDPVGEVLAEGERL